MCNTLDRDILIKHIHESLDSEGVFICGDIIRPQTDENEKIYLNLWINEMKNAGLSDEEIGHITLSRRTNYQEMETVSGFYGRLKKAGFSQVMMPYKSGITAVFIGFK